MNATESPQSPRSPIPDLCTQLRRGKALALLKANPSWRMAIIVEATDPVIICIAIRGAVYGELEVPAERYDARVLCELLDRYELAAAVTIH